MERFSDMVKKILSLAELKIKVSENEEKIIELRKEIEDLKKVLYSQ